MINPNSLNRLEKKLSIDPNYKDQAALDRELEPLKAEIRKRMDAEAKIKRRILYEFKPTDNSYQK